MKTKEVYGACESDWVMDWTRHQPNCKDAKELSPWRWLAYHVANLLKADQLEADKTVPQLTTEILNFM